jgi:thymidylate kinase
MIDTTQLVKADTPQEGEKYSIASTLDLPTKETGLMLKRDYFFEFAGMPKSGKTTVSEVVVHYLKRRGFRVREYHGGGRYAPIDKSAHSSLNLYLIGKAVEFVITSVERENTQSRIFLMDRGIFDGCIFTNVQLRMGKIDTSEAAALKGYLTIPRLVSRIDGVFLFVTEPQLSMSRETRNKLTQKSGRVMNTSFLENLRLSSLEEYESLRYIFPHVRMIDTKMLDGKIIECARLVLADIFEIIEVERNEKHLA